MNDWATKGYLEPEEIKTTLPRKELLMKHLIAISECIQEIPCNPCVTVCPSKAITMKDINAIPVIDYEKCNGCGKCVGICPGLALFLIGIKNGKGIITLPYEMLPLPGKGNEVYLLNRKGERLGKGIVMRTVIVNKQTKSSLITVLCENEDDIYHIRNIEIIR